MSRGRLEGFRRTRVPHIRAAYVGIRAELELFFVCHFVVTGIPDQLAGWGGLTEGNGEICFSAVVLLIAVHEESGRTSRDALPFRYAKEWANRAVPSALLLRHHRLTLP